MKRNKSGLTVAELLLILAIGGVLLSILGLVFSNLLEQSNETADIAHARTAYAEIMVAAITDDKDAEYEGRKLRQTDGSYEALLFPVMQRVDGWAIDIGERSIGGIKSGDWKGRPRTPAYCTITVYPENSIKSNKASKKTLENAKVVIRWGLGYAKMSLKALHDIDNEMRVKRDQTTLDSLGEAIMEKGWTVPRLKKALALPEAQKGEDIRIADYDQLKSVTYQSRGFRIIAKRGGALDKLLAAAEYDSGRTLKRTETTEQVITLHQSPLFFSDELGTNRYNLDIKQTRRSIYIGDIETGKKGIIQSFTIYTRDSGGQAEMTDEERDQFRVDVR